MGKRWIEIVGTAYSGAAMLATNSITGFLLLNAVLAAGYLVADRFLLRQNAIAAKYGDSLVAMAYPGYSEGDVSALLSETWDRRMTYQPYTLFRESPYRGRFVNVHEAGFRYSKNQGQWPPNPRAFNVFVFGGSTTFSYGLADTETLPSFIQESMRRVMTSDVRVYNFAMGAYQSTQERIAFEELLAHGFVPNMVIFVDGLNEFAFPHVPKGTAEARLVLDGGRRTLMAWVMLRGLNAMPVGRLARSVAGMFELTAIDDEGTPATDAQVRQLVDGVTDRYLANRRLISSVARQFGVQPVFVWQPIPFYKYDQRYHAFATSKLGVNRYASAGYEHAASRFGKNDEDTTALWLGDLQEGIAESLYADNVHYTAAMCQRVADNIVAHIMNNADIDLR